MNEFKPKRMAFYELGKGRLAQLAQAEFERAQVISAKTGAPVKITTTIVVYPKEGSDEHFGGVAFEVKITLPATKSMKYTTELSDDGYIISEGTDVDDLLQESLEFPEIVSVNKKTGEVING